MASSRVVEPSEQQIRNMAAGLQRALVSARAEQAKGGTPDPEVVEQALGLVARAVVMLANTRDPKKLSVLVPQVGRVEFVLRQIGADVPERRRGAPRKPAGDATTKPARRHQVIAGQTRRLSDKRGKNAAANLLSAMKGLVARIKSRGMSPTVLAQWQPLYAAYTQMVKAGTVGGKKQRPFDAILVQARKVGLPVPRIKARRPGPKTQRAGRGARRPGRRARRPGRRARRPGPKTQRAAAEEVTALVDSGGAPPSAQEVALVEAATGVPSPDAGGVPGDVGLMAKLTDLWEETLWPPDKPVYARPALWGGLLLGSGIIWGATRKGGK